MGNEGNTILKYSVVFLIILSLFGLVSADVPTDTNGYFNFNTSGDSTGNHTNLTFGTSANTTGFINSGRDFFGSTANVVNMTDSFSFASGDFTVFLWVFPNTTGGDTFFSSNSGTNGFTCGKFFFTADERLQCSIQVGGVDQILNSPSSMSITSYTLIGLNVNNLGATSNMSMWWNGTRVASQIVNSLSITSTILAIGSSPTSGTPLTGKADEFALWSRSLNDTEMINYANCQIVNRSSYAFNICNPILPSASLTFSNINLTNGTITNNPNVTIGINISATDTNTNITTLIVFPNGTNYTIGTNTQNVSYEWIFNEGLNTFYFYAFNNQTNVTSANYTRIVKTSNPNLTNNIASQITSYNINLAQNITFNDSLGISYCYFNVSNGQSALCNVTSFNFSQNGNLTYNITVRDIAGNMNSSLNNLILVNPQFNVTFLNNTQQVTNFDINGTAYTDRFTGYIYDYGLGNHTFLFQKAGYQELNFTLEFNLTSNINTTVQLSPVYINFILRDIRTGDLAAIGNYTILVNDINTNVSDIYQIINNNTLSIINTYENQSTLRVDLVYNSTVLSTLTIINPRVDLNLTFYVINEDYEQRIIEVLDGSYNVIVGTDVELYVLVEGTGEFELFGIKTTSSFGRVTFPVILFDVVYTVCNTYNGQQVCLNQITFDTSEDPLQLVHSEDFPDQPVNILDKIRWSYSENKSNVSSQMTLTFNDVSAQVTQFCYNVSRSDDNGSITNFGAFCNIGYNGQVVQTFALNSTQILYYTFYYTYNGEDYLLDTYTSYGVKPLFDIPRDLSYLDFFFLFVFFGAIGVLLEFKRMDIYNLGILIIMLVVFSVQGVINESYVNIGVWSLLAIMKSVYHAIGGDN